VNLAEIDIGGGISFRAQRLLEVNDHAVRLGGIYTVQLPGATALPLASCAPANLTESAGGSRLKP
jgi:hypothetical protein